MLSNGPFDTQLRLCWLVGVGCTPYNANCCGVSLCNRRYGCTAVRGDTRIEGGGDVELSSESDKLIGEMAGIGVAAGDVAAGCALRSRHWNAEESPLPSCMLRSVILLL